MDDPAELAWAVSELDCAFVELRANETEQRDERVRRTQLDRWLTNMYKLRDFRFREFGGTKKDYFSSVVSPTREGRVTEGIVVLRNSNIHALAAVRPATQPLYPGDKTLVSEHLFVGSNLTWLHPSAMDKAAGAQMTLNDKGGLYVAELAGMAVLPSMEMVRNYLVDPGPPGARTL